MTPHKEFCPHCGTPIEGKPYTHSFTHSLGQTLKIIFWKMGITLFHPQKDFTERELTKNQYCNLQKMKYFGVLKQVEGKTGYWILTDLGADFILGLRKIPKWVETVDAEVVKRSVEHTSLEETIGFYQLPKEWAKEATRLKRERLLSVSGQREFSFK